MEGQVGQIRQTRMEVVKLKMAIKVVDVTYGLLPLEREGGPVAPDPFRPLTLQVCMYAACVGVAQTRKDSASITER